MVLKLIGVDMGTGAYTSTVICGVHGFMRRIDLYVTRGIEAMCPLVYAIGWIAVCIADDIAIFV